MADNTHTTCALLDGFDHAKRVPFDVFEFLNRMAAAGAPVCLGPDGGVLYVEPVIPSEDHQFLIGWHNGARSAGAVEMVRKVLRENSSIRNVHLALAEQVAAAWAKAA